MASEIDFLKTFLNKLNKCLWLIWWGELFNVDHCGFNGKEMKWGWYSGGWEGKLDGGEISAETEGSEYPEDGGAEPEKTFEEFFILKKYYILQAGLLRRADLVACCQFSRNATELGV